MAGQPIYFWSNNWLIMEISASFPQNSIVYRESLAKTGRIITFKAKRQYDEMEYQIKQVYGKSNR